MLLSLEIPWLEDGPPKAAVPKVCQGSPRPLASHFISLSPPETLFAQLNLTLPVTHVYVLALTHPQVISVLLLGGGEWRGWEGGKGERGKGAVGHTSGNTDDLNKKKIRESGSNS